MDVREDLRGGAGMGVGQRVGSPFSPKSEGAAFVTRGSAEGA